MIRTDEEKVAGARYPTILNANFVRVAHVYNGFTTQVRSNFTVAGLVGEIEVSPNFCILIFLEKMYPYYYIEFLLLRNYHADSTKNFHISLFCL